MYTKASMVEGVNPVHVANKKIVNLEHKQPWTVLVLSGLVSNDIADT